MTSIACPERMIAVNIHNACQDEYEVEVLKSLCDGKLNYEEFKENIQISRPKQLERFGSTFYSDEKTVKGIFDIVKTMHKPTYIPFSDMTGDTFGWPYACINAYDNFSTDYRGVPIDINYMWGPTKSKYNRYECQMGWVSGISIPRDFIGMGWTPIACAFLPHNKGAVPLSKTGEAIQPWKDKEHYTDFFECLEECNIKAEASFKDLRETICENPILEMKYENDNMNWKWKNLTPTNRKET